MPSVAKEFYPMSSPLQSPRLSPVSSRDSTPASPSALNGSPETPTMTPRTKIRSLLQDISDSDSDAARSPTQPKHVPHECSLQPAVLHDQRNETEGKGSEADSEDDKEGDLPVAPRGRMAARMRAQESKMKPASSSIDEYAEGEGGETTYERIKRRYAAEQIPEKESEKVTSDEQASDAVVPKPIRRRFLLSKKQKVGLDENAPPQSGQSSPPGSPDVPTATENSRQSAQSIKKKFLFKKKQNKASEGTIPPSLSGKSSPSLFVSPHGPYLRKEDTVEASEAGHESDSEAPSNPKVSSAFLALVERKRKERETKEAAEKKEKAEKAARLNSLYSSLMHSSEDESDQDATGKKLTQQSRPTRKASKRALEEMNRETQRMSRNMQLAHQARTKKKITKESFFARFNLSQTVPAASISSPTSKGDNTPATASSVPPSDAEGRETRDTPPTSPLAPDDAKKSDLPEALPILEADEVVMHENEELPSLMEFLNRPTPMTTPTVDKGKGKANEGEPVKEGEFPMEDAVKPKRQIRVKLPSPKTSLNRQPNDSDDDLVILGSASVKKSRALALLDRVPSKRTKEDRALLMLRSLAHLTSHERQGPQNKSSMTSGEMQASLRQKARQQAAQERAEKIQQLKDRGIIIQTSEERERDQQEVEDLIEKGRREAAEIGKKEKEAAKKVGEGGFGDSDDDDEDYAGSEGEDDIVGSEDEDTDDDEGENQEEGGNDELALDDGDSLVEKEAVEDDSEEDPEDSEEEADDLIDDIEEDEPLEEHLSRKPRVARVISDDEEDEADPNERRPLSTPVVPPRFVMPGLPPSDDLALGLTQAFAATIADSQSQPDPAETQEQDSFAILRNMPEPDFPSLKILETDSQEVIKDSQVQESLIADDVVLDFTQTPSRQSVPESPLIGISTQQSMPDPTQDVGFVMSPLLGRRGPPSTVETVLLGIPEDSPVMKKNGRLMRRADVLPETSIPNDSQSQLAEDEFKIGSSAFDVMRKGAKKAAVGETFDKTRSNAKGMVEEVAEESEDEYAGLGGASDESAGEEDEEDRKMINDDGKEKVEEQKLAALYADKERVSDEAAVTKLYKDLTTGALRRKRGAGSDLDLSESDEDKEAQRRAKRREFQRMRQAMFADEKLGRIADDKKKSAFLRAIEDREDDEELDLGFSDGEVNDDSQSQSQSQNPGDAQDHNDEGAATTSENDSRKRKRPLEPSDAGASNRLPPALRGKAATESKRPSTLDEIRQTVSFLVDEPDSFIAPQPSSDNESSDQEEERIPATYDENGELNEDEDDDDLDFIDDSSKPYARPSYTARRTNSEPKPSTSSKPKTTVIDRLSLLRTRTSSLSSNLTSKSRQAFHAPANGPNPGFRVPTLLRRATTNSSINSSGSSTNTSGGFGTERSASDRAKTKVTVGGGSKKASVNFYQKSRLEERERELKGRVGKKGKVPARTPGQGVAGLLGRKGSWD